jgi:hypothetical protein
VAEIHFFRGGGAKPPKFPTKLPNFRHTPIFALEKTVFSPLLKIPKIHQFSVKVGGGCPSRLGGSPRVESTENDNSKMYVQRHRWNGVEGLNSNFLCMSCLNKNYLS